MSSCVGSAGRHPSLPLPPHLLPPWEVVASFPEAFPGPGRSPHPHLSKSLLVPQGADDEGHEAALHEPAQGQLGTQGQEVPDLIQIQGAVAGDRDEGCVRKHEWVTPRTLSIFSDAGWAPRVPKPPWEAWDSGLLFPRLA